MSDTKMKPNKEKEQKELKEQKALGKEQKEQKEQKGIHKEQKEQKEQKEVKKVGSDSSHTTQAPVKRKLSEVANSSAEELVLLSGQMEEVTSEVKQITQSLKDLKARNDNMMTKDEMSNFIKATVEGIMREINQNMELTIDLKVEEKVSEKMKNSEKEIEQLKEKNQQLERVNKQLTDELTKTRENTINSDKISKMALEKANLNEQYSRKNNIKIMNIEQKEREDETTLMNTVGSLLAKQGITLTPEQVIAIHRIPGKQGSIKPVLLKLRNNNDKTMIMRKRAGMKTCGYRLVDDVTKLNSNLIRTLLEHRSIDSAWYFNGAVYGKTVAGKRLKFDLHDDIDYKITKSND